MERYILLQSYAPADAGASAQKAQLFAQEMAGWRNFDTAGDQAMAPVANWVREDLSNSLYAGQNFDRGISDQMKLDVQRADITLNGAEMKHADGDDVAKSLRRIMPTEDAAKLVSAILNQRTFSYVGTLSTQMNAETGKPLPQEVLGGLTKMASRNILQAMENNLPPMLHFDLNNQADHDFRVTVQNGRAHIEMSETVGLDSGLGTDANGQAKLVGKARYTLTFECDLGTPPSILSVDLRQRILPVGQDA
ncbi:MAG: hypothetical protein K6F46_02615 [Desulfovibrio sp.]|nr:hypothetical protein [Desulfovibrio sp.]